MNRFFLSYTIAFALVLGSFSLLPATEYWIAPNGNDHADGTSRATAWASPSRGQPTRLGRAYKAGDSQLAVVSTHGFLERGQISVAGQVRTYHKKSSRAFHLNKPFTKSVAVNSLAFDAKLLAGKSFSPGDVINLADGTYTDRPLNFCQSGTKKRPIHYRSFPGERAVLVSTRFNVSPVWHLGNRRSPRTRFVVLSNLSVRNSADGNHGAAGIHLFGVSHVTVRGCDVDISGRDINGDNNALHLFDADHVTIAGCRFRSRYANGIAAWATTAIDISHSLVYESFHGVMAAGGRYTSHLSLRNCTIYATNQHGGIHAEEPGRVTVTNSIIAQIPSLQMAALKGPGGGDYNLIWHAASLYGTNWNGTKQGSAGKHDSFRNPKFISLNPANPDFLKFTADSPAATAGQNRSYVGAFAPTRRPVVKQGRRFDVKQFGARGDGIHDDSRSIQAALAAAKSGDRVVFPPTPHHYLISKPIRVSRDRIHLYGPGATIKLKAGAGRIHMIHVGGTGPNESIVEQVTVEGLALHGNYRRQPQQRAGGIPRGVWVENAVRVTVKNVTMRDVYCGLSFAKNTRHCEAIEVTVSDWDHDAFGASGWGQNGGCSDIRFLRCKATNARCIKAWEIEEGAQRVRLEDCLIENLSGTGTGYYVRHHAYRWPLLVDQVTFVRCKVRKISGAGFLIATVPGKAIRPYIRTRDIRMLQCESDAPVTIGWGVEQVEIRGGIFTNTVALGFNAKDVATSADSKWPVRSVKLSHCQVKRLVINGRLGNASGRLGDSIVPNYRPRIRLDKVRLSLPLQLIGKHADINIKR